MTPPRDPGTAYVPRTKEQTLADIAVMAEAVERLKHVMYARDFFEKRYEAALRRVVPDLEKRGIMLEAVHNEDKKKLVQDLRKAAERTDPPQEDPDKPITLPADIGPW